MAEWKLFDGESAEFSQLSFFEEHHWVSPDLQAGHHERTGMMADLVRRYQFTSLSDLGCGDGSFLASVVDIGVPMWGFDVGRANVAKAVSAGLAVEQADILTGVREYGDLSTSCEVLEHLANPYDFVASIPSRLLAVSSPSAETDEWHYEHHAWAWDLDGYRALVERAGWNVLEQVECDGGVNHHGGRVRRQRFQAVIAERQ